VRAELAGLGRELAAETGAHLAAASFFFESDPDRAWAHAVAARRRAARLGVVRETAGLAAYRAGQWADALAELRTARRITGSSIHLPVMADAERGLGRPERALELAHSPEARQLDRNSKIEMLIVESGARADMGEHDAAVVVLQIPELDSSATSPTLARLRFAYSEALNRAEREKEAEAWRIKAMDSDRDGTASLYADDEIVDLLEDADDVEYQDDGEDDGERDGEQDDDEDQDGEQPDGVEGRNAADPELKNVHNRDDADDSEPDDSEPDDDEPELTNVHNLTEDGEDLDDEDADDDELDDDEPVASSESSPPSTAPTGALFHDGQAAAGPKGDA
jgi:hypothetical protein